MNLGMPEMIFIFLLALIIFGPRKLPEIGRQLGRALTEFKRASNSFQAQLEDEIRQLEFEEQNTKTIQAPEPAVPAEPPAGTVSYNSSAAAANGNGHASVPSAPDSGHNA